MCDEVSSYRIHGYQVFYSNQYLPNARWSDFQDLNQDYGQFVPNTHPYSFELIDKTYAKDHQHIFHNGQIMKPFQPHAFHSINNFNHASILSYEIRDFKVFFDNKHLPDARWIDFTNLGHAYGKDIHHVFFMGNIVEDAHAFSFEVLESGYAKDRNHVFYNGKIVHGVHPTGFQVPRYK